MRVLIEVVHTVIGLAAAVVIASLAAWAYPRATSDIWLVAEGAMVVVLLMGVGPLRRAWAEDRAAITAGSKNGSANG